MKVMLLCIAYSMHQPLTSDFVLRDILFSDLKRLHEIEENLKNLHVPKKPSNGDEESPVECYKRRVAENQKEAYLEEIARLNKKIYGISLSDESIHDTITSFMTVFT